MDRGIYLGPLVSSAAMAGRLATWFVDCHIDLVYATASQASEEFNLTCSEAMKGRAVRIELRDLALIEKSGDKLFVVFETKGSRAKSMPIPSAIVQSLLPSLLDGEDLDEATAAYDVLLTSARELREAMNVRRRAANVWEFLNTIASLVDDDDQNAGALILERFSAALVNILGIPKDWGISMAKRGIGRY